MVAPRYISMYFGNVPKTSYGPFKLIRIQTCQNQHYNSICDWWDTPESRHCKNVYVPRMGALEGIPLLSTRSNIIFPSPQRKQGVCGGGGDYTPRGG